MKDLEQAVSQLLRVHLVRRGGLEYGGLAEDVDEDGHYSLEEDWVAGHVGIMVQAVPQRGCRLDLESEVYRTCHGQPRNPICSGGGASREWEREWKWEWEWAREGCLPSSGALSFLTTSSIRVLAMAATFTLAGGAAARTSASVNAQRCRDDGVVGTGLRPGCWCAVQFRYQCVEEARFWWVWKRGSGGRERWREEFEGGFVIVNRFEEGEKAQLYAAGNRKCRKHRSFIRN